MHRDRMMEHFPDSFISKCKGWQITAGGFKRVIHNQSPGVILHLTFSLYFLSVCSLHFTQEDVRADENRRRSLFLAVLLYQLNAIYSFLGNIDFL